MRARGLLQMLAPPAPVQRPWRPWALSVLVVVVATVAVSVVPAGTANRGRHGACVPRWTMGSPVSRSLHSVAAVSENDVWARSDSGRGAWWSAGARRFVEDDAVAAGGVLLPLASARRSGPWLA